MLSQKQSLQLSVAVLVLVFAAVFWMAQAGKGGAKVAGSPVVVHGQTADGEERVVDFTLRDLAGGQVSLSDYEGQIIYLNFWATWCKWCKKEMPDMESIHRVYKDRGVAVLAVSVGEELGKVDEFIEEHGYSFKVLLDPDKTVSQAYRVRPIPVSLFLDRNGEIAYRKLGYMNDEQMREQLEALLAPDAN